MCRFYHIYTTVIVALEWLLPTHNKAECRNNTCTEQQYIVTSNINDIKIYTCNLTALLNILRHFCNSIDLLVSSALGSNNRKLSSLKKKKRERERKMDRKREMAHIYHIHILKLSLYGSYFVSLYYGIVWYILPILSESLAYLSQEWFQNNIIIWQDVFPLHCEVCFVYGEMR